MRVLITFSGPSFAGIEDFNGGFYVNAVSLDNALALASKILFIAGIKTDRVSCQNELSDEFNEWPLDTFKGLNGTIRCTGRRSSMGDMFERVFLLERGKVTKGAMQKLEWHC